MVNGRVLGLAVGEQTVRAVLVRVGAIEWAGSAAYRGLDDLAEVIARLAGEAGRPVRRARVALMREMVQLRTVHPAPPLKARDVSRYVELEVDRLFRKNGAPLVTDGVLVAIKRDDRALWGAAASEPLLTAILDGCSQAGMIVESLAPSADTIPAALDLPGSVWDIAIPNGSATERLNLGIGGVWRSRWGRGLEPLTGAWVPALAALDGERGAMAPAFAAAVRLPTLRLLPNGQRAAIRKTHRRRLAVVGIAGFMLWVLAGGMYVTRLSLAYAHATHLLTAFRSSADSALSLRRDLDAAHTTLATIAQARASRSRTLQLLGDFTRALPDSVTLIALHVAPDGTLRLVGYAPRAAQAVAAVGRVPGIKDAALDGQVTQEVIGGIGRDRFSVIAKLVRP